jgi:hypothetical protein
MNVSDQREAPGVLPRRKAALVEFVNGASGADPLFHVHEYTEKLN